MTRIEQLVDEFSQRSEIAPATRKAYRWNLRATLVPFCRREGLAEPEELTPDVLDQLAREVEAHQKTDGAPLARESRRSYMTAVRQYVSWLGRRRGVAGLDHRAVQVPNKRRILKTLPSREEIRALEDAAPTERNKLIVRLLADTGAREGEVAGLRCDALVAKAGGFYFAEVEGKTGRRSLPISPQMHRRLAAHRDGRTGRPRSSSPALFLSRVGTPLTEHGVYRLVWDASERAGMRRVGPHLLRAAAITWMLATPPGGLGLPATYVSAITGVSVNVIAAHYDHATDEQHWLAMARAWGSAT